MLTVLSGFIEDIHMANRNWASSKMFTGHVMPVLLDCNFIVDSTNPLGIKNLKGPYIQNVFMHTSTTPGAGNSNPQTPNQVITNPNPASGTIVVQFQDNYSRVYNISYTVGSPDGTDVKIDNSALTAGVAYKITILGNATAAKWHAIGVPAGITPAVGVTFIAATNGGAGNTLTSRAAPSATAGSGCMSIESFGDRQADLAPSISAQGFGAQLILQSRKVAGTNASDGPPETFTGSSAIAALSDGTIVSLKFLLSNSSVLVNGE